MSRAAKAPVPAPDRTIRLSDLPPGFLTRIASAMIARHGFYTFVDASDGAKVMVLP